MPQDFLDGAQIRSLLQHVRPKRMPQRVGMNIRRHPVRQRDSLHNPSDTSGRQPTIAAQSNI